MTTSVNFFTTNNTNRQLRYITNQTSTHDAKRDYSIFGCNQQEVKQIQSKVFETTAPNYADLNETDLKHAILFLSAKKYNNEALKAANNIANKAISCKTAAYLLKIKAASVKHEWLWWKNKDGIKDVEQTIQKLKALQQKFAVNVAELLKASQRNPQVDSQSLQNALKKNQRIEDLKTEFESIKKAAGAKYEEVKIKYTQTTENLNTTFTHIKQSFNTLRTSLIEQAKSLAQHGQQLQCLSIGEYKLPMFNVVNNELQKFNIQNETIKTFIQEECKTESKQLSVINDIMLHLENIEDFKVNINTIKTLCSRLSFDDAKFASAIENINTIISEHAKKTVEQLDVMKKVTDSYEELTTKLNSVKFDDAQDYIQLSNSINDIKNMSAQYTQKAQEALSLQLRNDIAININQFIIDGLYQSNKMLTEKLLVVEENAKNAQESIKEILTTQRLNDNDKVFALKGKFIEKMKLAVFGYKVHLSDFDKALLIRLYNFYQDNQRIVPDQKRTDFTDANGILIVDQYFQGTTITKSQSVLFQFLFEHKLQTITLNEEQQATLKELTNDNEKFLDVLLPITVEDLLKSKAVVRNINLNSDVEIKLQENKLDNYVNICCEMQATCVAIDMLHDRINKKIQFDLKQLQNEHAKMNKVLGTDIETLDAKKEKDQKSKFSKLWKPNYSKEEAQIQEINTQLIEIDNKIKFLKAELGTA